MGKKYESLKMELEANHIEFPNLSGISKDSILIELYTCLHPEKHECHIAPYGIAFCETRLPESMRAKLIPLEYDEIDGNRRFVDGRRSFLLFYKDRKPQIVIFDSAFGDEYRLLELSAFTSGIVIQRQQTGVVKIIQRGGIHTCDGRSWSYKGSTNSAYSQLKLCLRKLLDNSLSETINGLLRMSFYSLSPEGIGATLVCRLPGSNSVVEGTRLDKLGISVQDLGSYSLALHILRFQDGATFVHPTGEFDVTGVQLAYSKEAAVHVPEIRGTRHTSAARYTFDHSDVVAFVVSQDGPVTVFSDGANIAELPLLRVSSEASFMKVVSPRKDKEGVREKSFIKKCSSCGRTVCIEEVVLPGIIDRKRVDCPICRKELYSSTFLVKAYPIKFKPPKYAIG